MEPDRRTVQPSAHGTQRDEDPELGSLIQEP